MTSPNKLIPSNHFLWETIFLQPSNWLWEVFNLPLSSHGHRCSTKQTAWSEHCDCHFATAPIRYCHEKPIQCSLISRHAAWYHWRNGWLMRRLNKRGYFCLLRRLVLSLVVYSWPPCGENFWLFCCYRKQRSATCSSADCQYDSFPRKECHPGVFGPIRLCSSVSVAEMVFQAKSASGKFWSFELSQQLWSP